VSAAANSCGIGQLYITEKIIATARETIGTNHVMEKMPKKEVKTNRYPTGPHISGKLNKTNGISTY
jgi:hypothetical protein